EPPRREASPARSAPRESAVAAVLADRKPLATVPAPAAPATETTPSPPPLEGSPALDLHYYAAGELDVYPVPRAPLTVALPAAAGRSAIEGWVRLLVQIDETGSVGSAEVHDAKAPEIFDAAALEAVRGARFVQPGKDDTEVRSRLMLWLEFRAPDGGRDEFPARSGFGYSSHMRPGCRMRPASWPASSPNPQKKSARTGPLIAAPVSWANTSRLSGVAEPGQVVARKTGAPRGMLDGSTAMLRPAVSAAPSVPLGPLPLSGSSRKKT